MSRIKGAHKNFIRQANLFAAYLLITDDILQEYRGYTREQLSSGTGLPMELIDLRLQ